MKKKLITILLFFYSLALSAQEASLLQVRTIAISPYGIESEAQLSGIYFDLTNLLLNQAKIDREHYIYPYARIIHELKAGKTDLTIMFKYAELAPYVEYIFPLPPLKNVVVGRKEQPLYSINQLNGKTIAYLRGANFSDEIDKNIKINKYRVNDFSQAISMLEKGRVDAIIGPLEPIYSAAKRLNLSKSFFGQPLIVSERIPWLQLSKKSIHKGSITKLKKEISALIEQGELARLKSKYL